MNLETEGTPVKPEEYGCLVCVSHLKDITVSIDWDSVGLLNSNDDVLSPSLLTQTMRLLGDSVENHESTG